MLLARAAAAVFALATLAHASPAPSFPRASPSAVLSKPNIVFIIVDDQDARQNSIDTMPHLQRLLVDEGTRFNKFFAPISVCCPSRSSFLRSQCAHNTNITSVMPPYGGWSVFNEKGMNGHYLPTFLANANYDVRYVGKLMNGHSVNAFTGDFEADGFVDHAFLLDPNTYDYWSPAFSRANGTVEYRPGEYSTDLVAEKAIAFLAQAAETPDKPFFLGVAPIAPHSHISTSGHSGGLPGLFDLPRAAPRHAHLFQDVKLNSSRESHNPDVPSGASWVRTLDKLNSTNVEYIEEFYRARLQALQAVDELVEGVINKLEEIGKLDDTIVIYTSDNGFEANAGHRRQPGKTLPYEEDINVPLVVRGPGVPRGLVDNHSVYSLADLGSTVLHLAGAQADYDHDGSLVPLTHELREQVERDGGTKGFHLAEYWVEGIGEGKYGSGITRFNQTYRAVRVVEGDEINYSYAVWCTGEREIYDLNTDPDQMHNLALAPLAPTSFTARLHTRLDALLLVLKSCSGNSCRNPWKVIFRDGKVQSLRTALDEKYDAYFEALPRVRYSECRLGFHIKLEAPFWTEDLAYSPGKEYVPLDAGFGASQIVLSA
ncbi:hypothetical protein Rhopal_006546-T1 [Rhodotorula paludigena]|uniref:Arylsulfatase n=1 Tax=Rhodotorula paludigena TaxID=86838 RepID=A0AAV5GSK9_9BASI|nr:hypothetical protein Rhopal_006546-T1 [Rhodotorula paludigena]